MSFFRTVKTVRESIASFAILVLLCLCFGCSRKDNTQTLRWNQRAAAAYLDQRANRWIGWKLAARDQGTFCISCHTTMPYALSRRALDATLDQKGLAPSERKVIDDVTKRVQSWNEIQPYYEGQPTQSRGTEAVLNALILANDDALTGRLSPDTHKAFDQMWDLQQTSGDESGSWKWIRFDNEPWEAYDSAYYGATLAAIAVGLAPENYRATEAIQPNLVSLREYLRRNMSKQTLVNRASLLWASTKIVGLLTPDEQNSLVSEILSKQQPDGGWCTCSLIGNWKRRDGTPLPTNSDGYATGFLAYVLEQAGTTPDEVHLQKALYWLVRNQTWLGGHWEASSLNKRHYIPFFNGFHFMDDAATAYAALALAQAQTESTKTALR